MLYYFEFELFYQLSGFIFIQNLLNQTETYNLIIFK